MNHKKNKKSFSMQVVIPLIGITMAIFFLVPSLFSGCQQEKNSPGLQSPTATQEKNKMSIQKESFGKTREGEPVDIYTLSNQKGMTVKITNYGGIVTHIIVPGQNNEMVDVALGFDKLAPYLEGHPYFGALVGRYANRIAGGKFTLDGVTYSLAKNNGNHHLHGGLKGFDKVTWKAEPIHDETAGKVGLQLSYLSKDKEEDYPGNLEVTVVYTLSNKNELAVTYEAHTDQATPVNLTHHSYFNLNGAGKGDILGHRLMINAGHYTPVDAELIPTGTIAPVDNTPFDFRQPATIGARIDKVAGGYDHNFVLDNPGDALLLAAKVMSPTSQLVMEVYSTEPGLQLYTGNFLDGSIIGKNNLPYNQHTGFCLEAQHFPDSPNQPSFPSTILQPNQTYHQQTIYKFYLDTPQNSK